MFNRMALSDYEAFRRWSAKPRAWGPEGSGWRAWFGGSVVDGLCEVLDEHLSLGRAAAAIGCVPWLTSTAVVDRLLKMSACCVVLDKDAYLPEPLVVSPELGFPNVALAQQTAASAQAAAAAFSSVRSAVVYPAQVSANRTQLAQLLATNLLGRDLAAIAATEAQYEGMWANNSAAMSRYQVASAQAATLPQLSSPPAVANPSGVAAQASIVPAADPPAANLPTVPLLQQYLAYFDPQSGFFGLGNTWGNQFLSSGFPINLLSLFAQTWTAQGIQGVGSEVGQGLAEGEAAMGVRLDYRGKGSGHWRLLIFDWEAGV